MLLGFHPLIALIILAGIVAIVAIVLHQLGIKIPSFVIQICWVIFVICVAVFAIKILLGLA